MRSLLIFLSTLLFLSLSGCSTNAPLQSLYYNAEEIGTQKNMVIFLRGRGGSHEDFATEGFVDAVKNRDLLYDIVAPNAHFGYYFGETLVARLKADIIEPARAKGYQKIWLVGASMGGLGALMYSRYYPEDVVGVYIISPFLGYDKIIGEISKSGGARQWDPGAYNPDDDWQRMLWDWLKQHTDKREPKPMIYLGYGTEDTYKKGQMLVEELLPMDHVFKTSGGHTPETMKKLWDMFLEKDIL